MKKTFIIVSITVFVIVLITYIFFGKKLGLVPPSPTPPGKEAALVEANAAMAVESESLSDEDKTPSINVNISLSAEKVNVSAFALRLIYNYRSGDAPSYKDADASKEGTQINVNEDLIKAGWTFPVNTVYIDDEDNRVFIDLAAANLTPEGYYIDSTINIGSLEITPNELEESIVFEFDPQETHLFRKDAKEIRLELPDMTVDVD